MTQEQVTPYQAENKTKKEQVEEMFDNIAHRYDFLNHLLSMGIDIIWRKKAVAELSGLQPKTLLDVATGTGDFAIALTALKPEKITGLDLSAGMLEIGKKKVTERKLDSLIEMVKGDSENLPFKENSFDAVTVAYGVRNFEHLDKGLMEIFRVLKPGGKLVVLEFSKPTVFPVKQLFNFYFNYVCPLVGKTFSKDHRAYSYLPESVKAFPEGPGFISRLSGAGFKKTQWRPLTFGITSIYTGIK